MPSAPARGRSGAVAARPLAPATAERRWPPSSARFALSRQRVGVRRREASRGSMLGIATAKGSRDGRALTYSYSSLPKLPCASIGQANRGGAFQVPAKAVGDDLHQLNL